MQVMTMEEPLRSRTSTIDIYIKLAQYPILAEKIRERMRQEIFRRGIISVEEFEAEIEQKAIESQKREGVFDPFNKEPTAIWQERKARIREYQTDFYFGFNLPTTIFEAIVREVLEDQQVSTESMELAFNPELAPWDMLFSQGRRYESLPPPQREAVGHHLEEIKAVLIKGMISDQLPYIGVARQVFDIDILRHIHRHRIGRGKIGGKAAGMLLAWKILQQPAPEIGPAVGDRISIPDSYFIGTEVIYEFRRLNNLEHLMNQKYRSLDEIREDYPRIVQAHLDGSFPVRIVEQLRDLLARIANQPLIVRSSSLLEDSFGFSFAGKYQSHFCPNQGTTEQNLDDLLDAIRLTYASTLNPDAILYRKRNQLIDYDERMAILLQTLRGKGYGRYFLPTIAGVGFSQNSLRWNPKIRREDGFLRIVWGIGTRAVDRVGNDYTKLIALSHPELRPETTARAIRQYSQHYVDLIDLEENVFKTVPVREAMAELVSAGYPDVRYIASIDRGDYLENAVSRRGLDEPDRLVLTFDYLTHDRNFIKLMRTVLMQLERAYERPVDIEFTVEILPDFPYPEFRLHLLQCRPLSQREMDEAVSIPPDLPDEDIIFTAHQLIPDGRVEGIRYIVYVDPVVYRSGATNSIRTELGRAIGRLNKILGDTRFIMMGPGRWGSSNIELGVRVSYADIYNTRALVEMAVADGGHSPALSYGTHFYQDLVEAGIHALPLHLDYPGSTFRWEFFRDSRNRLADFSPEDADLDDYIKVIDVERATAGRRLTILMDGSNDKAVGYLADGKWEDDEPAQGSVSTF
jgi:hypothetical protein